MANARKARAVGFNHVAIEVCAALTEAEVEVLPRFCWVGRGHDPMST